MHQIESVCEASRGVREREREREAEGEREREGEGEREREGEGERERGVAGASHGFPFDAAGLPIGVPRS